MKKNIKVIVIVSILAIVLSISLAYFSYYRVGTNHEVVAGDVYMELENGNDTMNMTNVFPETVEEARDATKHTGDKNNIISFNVSGKNDTNKDIYYEILLNKGTDVQDKTRFLDEHLVFDLIEVVNNEDVYLLQAVSFNTINNTRIWTDTINSDDEIEKTYKIRMWLSDTVTFGHGNVTYEQDDYVNRYANIKVTVKGDFVEKKSGNLYSIVKNDVAKGYSSEYTGETQDSILNYGRQKVYYYNNNAIDNDSESETYGETMNNVIFADICWEIVRTTDTGGVKLIYNGKSVDGKCLSTRENQMGIRSSEAANNNLSGAAYYYGTGYEVDYENQTFKLSGTISNDIQWNESNADKLIEKYTCKNTNKDATCSTLYYVNSYVSNINAYVVPLTVGEISRMAVGTSAFNVVNDSPAYAGYMYNVVYKSGLRDTRINPVTNFIFANSFTYEDGKYTLNLDVGDDYKKIITDWTTEYNAINNTHYTCFNSTGECSTIYYVYNTSSNYIGYFSLKNNQSIESILQEMLASSNVNKKNSTIKSYIEGWFEANLNNYISYIEDVIYCNDRTYTRGYNSSGFYPNGGSTSVSLNYSSHVNTIVLKCPNTLDSFSRNNSKAKIKYPVGLLTQSEYMLRTKFNVCYGMTPGVYLSSNGLVYIRYLANNANVFNQIAYYIGEVRPVISLKPTTTFEFGNGSESSPYVVD